MNTVKPSCARVHFGSQSLRQVAFVVGAVAILTGCGKKDDDDDSPSSGGTGGIAATGGQSTTGGNRTTGGSSTTGGRATGGGGSSTGGAAPGGEGGSEGGAVPIAGTGPAPGGAGGAGQAPQGGVAGAATAGGVAGVATVGGAEPVAGAGAGGELAGGAGGVAGAPGGMAGQGGAEPTGPTTPLTLYVACADTTGSIQQYTLDRATWTATPVGTYTTGVTNSWLTLNANEDRVYVASRTEGRISTLSRDTTTGALALIDAVPVPMEPPGGAGGAGATGNPATQVLELDPGEQHVLAANFSANYVYVFELASDGTVGDLVASANDGVSSHQVVFAPDSTEGSVLVPYRGSDKIVTYRFDATDGSLTNVHEEQVDSDGQDATTGPRHLVFHPTQPDRVYSINEVSGTIDAFTYDDTAGDLTLQSSVSSVPPDYEGADKFASEIAVSPSGNFLFVSNRYATQATFTEEGSLGVFAVDADTGELTPVDFEGSRGALPRHFMLSADGTTLVVGNQNSNNIAVFTVSAATGELTFRFERDVCGTPFFIQLLGD